jgi:hypothetical protein
MAEHESSIGASDDWYTPADLLDAIGETYDLDPCAPEYGRAYYNVKAAKEYTIEHDGLSMPWKGFVFMNPPFGGRNGHVPWLRKFLTHRNGIAIVRAYTSAAWFHDYAVYADALCFPRGKTKFVRPDGSVGMAPGHGIVLLAMGKRGCSALERSNIGLFVSKDGMQPQFKPTHLVVAK